MKRYFQLLIFLCSSFIGTAQNNLPPVFEITTDTVLVNTLPTSYWQMLEDKDGKLSFDQVSTPPINNSFHYYTSKTNKPDYSVHGYWFRYVLKNTMDHDAKIFLGDPPGGNSDQSDFYFINANGKISHEVNGFLTPWNKLNGLKEYGVIPIELKPGDQVIIYRRIYNTYHFYLSILNFQIAFFSAEKTMQQIYGLSEKKYFGAIHDMFIVGVLAFAGLFIFFFFLIIREKVYLYFSLYLFALSIGRFNTGTEVSSEMYDVFFRQFPILYVYILHAIWFFSIFFLGLFIRQLLNTKILFPRWDKFLFIFNIVFVLSYLLHVVNDYTTILNPLLYGIINYEQLFIALSIPVTFFMSLKRVKQNKILTYIVLPLQSTWSICWSIAVFSLAFNTIPWLQANWYGFETILLSCLVTSFSWILLQRFGDLKKQIVQKELEKEIEKSQLIEKQKAELEDQVTERTAELKQSLTELKSTQAQLIQSEKMASLGELTAGIAHEIQNPLNFVNNFSEVNNELISELVDEVDKGNYDEVKVIAVSLKDNEEKINHHGKRADAIVKGMLQHSKQTKGVKELTDINSLCDEYLRLAYHGMRARDKSFNAEIKAEFDGSVGKINIIPQDIGRVLLNLFNNAFYAVNEKKKIAGDNYEAIVSITTKRINSPLGVGSIEIIVSDNGNGIPQNIVDKIFQPFFTTKPTGQGTGLGLSLAYDIIKAHGGEIKVESREGEGSEFIIQLPIN